MLRTPEIVINDFVDQKFSEDKVQSRLHKGKKMLSSLIKFI